MPIRTAIVLLLVLAGGRFAEAGAWRTAGLGLSAPALSAVAVQEDSADGSLWLLARAEGRGLLLRSRDGGASFAALDALPPGVRAVLPARGALWGLDPEGPALHLSTDQGLSWGRLSLDAGALGGSGNLSGAAFVPAAGRLLLAHGGGLARIDTATGAAACVPLLATAGLPAAACAEGDLLAVLRADAGLLSFSSSTDAGRTWGAAVPLARPWTATDRAAGLVLSPAGTGGVVLVQAGEASWLATDDGGRSWSPRPVASGVDAGAPVAAAETGGLRLVLLVSGGRPQLAASADGGATWRRSEVTDWAGAPLAASAAAADLAWYSDRGVRHACADPFAFVPPAPLLVTASLDAAVVEWPHHPLASSYDLCAGTQVLATALRPPVALSPLPADGTVLRLVPRRGGLAGTPVEAVLEAGAASAREYLLQAGATTEDYRLLSFPVAASVDKDGAALAPKAWLEATLGASYNESVWQFGRWNPALEAYEQGQGLGPVQPGRSYWIICAFNVSFTCRFREPAAGAAFLRLQPGWNMVASPWGGGACAWADMAAWDGLRRHAYADLAAAADPVLRPELWEWAPAGYRTAAALEPGAGYWVRNGAGRELLLELRRRTGTAKAVQPLAPLRGKSVEPPPPPAGLRGAAAAAGGGGCLLPGP